MSKKHPTKAEREEYNSKEKICKECGKPFIKSWAAYALSEFCSKECSKKYSSKTNRDNNKISESLRNYYSPIVKDNKEKYYSSPKYCPICNELIPYSQRFNLTCGKKDCAIASVVQKNRENGVYARTGGYREGSGRSKSGYWKGDFCGSTYELVYWIYCKEHNIPIERNTKRYPYIFEGKEHTYLPDYIVDGKLVEIKGYVNAAALAKAAAVPEGIQILTIKELEPMMEYVDKTYGTYHKGKVNNYHTLYDEYKPKFTYTCSHCGKEFTRDKELITELKFCSQFCSGKNPHTANTDYVDSNKVKETAIKVPGWDTYWFNKNDELFTEGGKMPKNMMLKLKMQIAKTGRKEYKLKGSRVNIQKLRKLCGFE